MHTEFAKRDFAKRGIAARSDIKMKENGNEEYP